MSKREITITNIFKGFQPTFHFGGEGQFLRSIAIDPDVPLTDASTDVVTAGAIRPVAYEKFSSTNVNSAPIAIINVPENTNTYTVLANGRLISYNSSLGSETLIGTVTGGEAHGACYYNNYIYIFTTTNVSRYGPLTNSPTLANTVWTGSTLGSQTALTDTTYPTTRHSIEYHNHWCHVHDDNKLYFTDYKDGRGMVHFIKTTKTTDEGDTDDGSTYNALDLPYGWKPYDIESFGTGLVISASQTTSSTVNNGRSGLFFWDTTSASFDKIIYLPDPLVPTLRNANGNIYVWSGSPNGGYRFSRLLGNTALQTIDIIEEGHPPLQGAVTAVNNRIVWGTFTTKPGNSASLLAYGSKSDQIPTGLHNIARSTVTATSSNGLVTAVSAQQGITFPKFLIGATDGTNYNIDKNSTTYQTSYIQSQVYNIGKSFKIKRIRIPLGVTLASNMTITPKLYFDNETDSSTGTTINSTNFSGKYLILEEGNFSYNTSGKSNFFLELAFSGTALCPVIFPIRIDLEIQDNENG